LIVPDDRSRDRTIQARRTDIEGILNNEVSARCVWDVRAAVLKLEMQGSSFVCRSSTVRFRSKRQLWKYSGLALKRESVFPSITPKLHIGYVSAADQGNPYAETHLASLYEAGQGVPLDYAAADLWYSRAVAAGDQSGVKHLQSLKQLLTPRQLQDVTTLLAAPISPTQPTSASSFGETLLPFDPR